MEYNNAMYTSGLNFVDDISEISPSAKLMEIVLSEKDFVKRQENIILFCNKFTRESIGDENSYWMYCIQTNIKLFPRFLLRLAKIWNDNGDYIKELAMICKEQGKISNDGDCWVDQYSGYIIKKIDFDTDELIFLATQATYCIQVLSSFPSKGYPLNDLIHPGYVFLVLIDGIEHSKKIIKYVNVNNIIN